MRHDSEYGTRRTFALTSRTVSVLDMNIQFERGQEIPLESDCERPRVGLRPILDCALLCLCLFAEHGRKRIAWEIISFAISLFPYYSTHH